MEVTENTLHGKNSRITISNPFLTLSKWANLWKIEVFFLKNNTDLNFTMLEVKSEKSAKKGLSKLF